MFLSLLIVSICVHAPKFMIPIHVYGLICVCCSYLCLLLLSVSIFLSVSMALICVYDPICVCGSLLFYGFCPCVCSSLYLWFLSVSMFP